MRHDPDTIMKHARPDAAPSLAPPLPSPAAAMKAATLMTLAMAPWSFFLCPPCAVVPLLMPDD